MLLTGAHTFTAITKLNHDKSAYFVLETNNNCSFEIMDIINQQSK